MKDLIRQRINNAVKKKFQIKDFECSLDVPDNNKFGDYSTNLAFALAKKTKKSPKEIAEAIALEMAKIKDFQKVEVAGGGFINFFINPAILEKAVGEILKAKRKYGSRAINQKNNKSKKQKTMVEFLSANPTGPMTLGNGRGGFSGDTLSNVLALSGHNIFREYYINDAGNQVKEVLSKSVKKALGIDLKIEEGEELYGGAYIEEIARKIKKEKGIEWVAKTHSRVGVLAAKIILQNLIKKDVKSFGIRYDNWLSEESLHKKGLLDKTWKILIKKNMVYEEEEAYWLKTTKYGDDKNRVIKTNEGNYTYLMGDIALLYDRFVLRKFDKVIVFVGADHHGYLGRWYAACEMLGIKKDRLVIIVMQIVRAIQSGEEVRMSKRKGTFITLREVVEDIGLDAARYFFISRDFNTHIDIDLDLAKEENNRNPVYYIQYASARMNSVLAKVRNHKRRITKHKKISNLNDQNSKYELDLIKKMLEWPGLISEIAGNFQVYKVANYAYELAGVFHRFYDNCRIIGDEREKERLLLIRASKIILESVLRVMGIEAKKKM
ncbi:arginine--tRNA ligase [Candidatus Microgenomates bacterium]|nr:arginine--tRNA ligase [Candidatus Microgenomates bacterium]